MAYLSDRTIRVERPRLRAGEAEGSKIELPAYEAMKRSGALADRMLEILLAGVSARKYEGVIREMADAVAVRKSAVSREQAHLSRLPPPRARFSVKSLINS